MNQLIEINWLKENLNDPKIKIIDGTLHMPASGLNAFEVFKDKHIPNAIFVDLEEISDQNSNLPHMMPDNNYFSKNDNHPNCQSGYSWQNIGLFLLYPTPAQVNPVFDVKSGSVWQVCCNHTHPYLFLTHKAFYHHNRDDNLLGYRPCSSGPPAKYISRDCRNRPHNCVSKMYHQYVPLKCIIHNIHY